MAFWASLAGAFGEILTAPFTSGVGRALWWQLGPVLFIWFLLEVYLDRHKQEELGWNSALSLGISTFWIVLASMQPLLFFRAQYEPFRWGAFFVLALFLLYAAFVTFAAFTHYFGKRLSYALAYPTVTYYIATFSILWGYGALDVNGYVLLAFLILWAIIAGLRFLLFWLLPEAHDVDAEPAGKEGESI